MRFKVNAGFRVIPNYLGLGLDPKDGLKKPDRCQPPTPYGILGLGSLQFFRFRVDPKMRVWEHSKVFRV